MSGWREGTRAHYRDAAYYDQAYQKRRGDVRFYAELAKKHRGPVLELGVGTGRVALAIARAGIELVGVDLMPEMLEKARERVAKEPAAVRDLIQLRQGDLRTVRLRRKFPLVIAPFNVFMHLYERQDWERALRTVHAHLAPGGRFALDLLMPDPFTLSRDPNRKYTAGKVFYPAHGKHYKYFERYDYDALTQVQTVTMEFYQTPNVRRVATPLSQRQTYPAELEMLLHYNGFKVEKRFGTFEGAPLDSESESQIIVAKAQPAGRANR